MATRKILWLWFQYMCYSECLFCRVRLKKSMERCGQSALNECLLWVFFSLVDMVYLVEHCFQYDAIIYGKMHDFFAFGYFMGNVSMKCKYIFLTISRSDTRLEIAKNSYYVFFQLAVYRKASLTWEKKKRTIFFINIAQKLWFEFSQIR